MVLDEGEPGIELYSGMVRLGTSAEEESGPGGGEEMETIPAVVGRSSHGVVDDMVSPGEN